MDKEVLRKFKEMDSDERRKLIQLFQEKKSGNDDKIEWMYKEHNVDNEDYLLGRKVDKTFTDATFEQPATSPDAPGALFTEVIARRSQLDMQVKMKEDPLYIIRQKEMEAKRRVLENPLKMQKLKAIIEKESKDKRESKKSKKNKRSKRDSSSSSDEETKELLKKYLEIKKMKEGTTELMKKENISKLDDKHQPCHGRHREQKMGREKDKSHKGTEDKRITSHHHSDDEDQPRKSSKFGLEVKSHRNSYEHKQVDYSNISAKKPVQELPKRRKLTDHEKEEMRRQMMSNAKERDLERQQKVKRHREEDEVSEDTTHSNKSFLEPMIVNMTSKSNIEDRVKRSRHTIQRSKDDYHKNFVKR